MTSDEALKVWLPVIRMGVENMLECKEALEMAIKALEQQKNEWQAGYDMAWKEAEVVFEKEPLEECEDAISRKEVLDLCDSNDPEYKISHLREDVECLPSVQPQQRIGRWILVSERLPEEKREWYLAVFKEIDTGFQLIPRVADYIGENNWRIIDEDGLVKEYRDILECVAWMPLPEPYKAGK